jgi:isoleucyl-tRNA synthetase
MIDYSKTLYLPETTFPMRAGLPVKEPEILAYWERIGLYGKLRAKAAGKPKFVLHDGPPYANGNIHIGHALNKVMKDLVTKSQQMLGFDSNYVPGWDCHGLPIEWKIEEQYRAKGKNKDDIDVVEFRKECRTFADHWVNVQREEFKRLGVIGDWAKPYKTMDFAAESHIVNEIHKFVENGLLYRGSKPIMWSVVEKTALAEAEVEYHDHTSDAVWVKFPYKDAFIVIWTTTPWTLPGNRAISYSRKISYSSYKITDAPEINWAKVGETYILADKLAEGVFKQAKVTGYERVSAFTFEGEACAAHPLAHLGYTFQVPLLDGDHVTDDAGTGFVHTAPSHGREDFEIWMSNQAALNRRGIDTRIPFTIDDDSIYTAEAPGFEGKRVITDKGDKGDANEAVIKALADAGNIIARARLKHQYPHSWRSKKPVIFRNTPQMFISMDKKINTESLREIALNAIKETEWVPASGENRINGMIENRPDWVLSRQRAWGVPIAVFIHKVTKKILFDSEVNARIVESFAKQGADAWYQDASGQGYLGSKYNAEDYDKINDVIDVWFDSGSTHAFVLDDAVEFPAFKDLKRKVHGGQDTVMYLEGSDQHRGWFHSSLLESCGTRGHAPFDIVLTHGFVLDEQGKKMSKSLGNVTAPQDIIKDSGADILRLWIASSDYSDDLRVGKEILKNNAENYKKLRNTLRWMLGTLAHYDNTPVAYADLPELERYMLSMLAGINEEVKAAYAAFDYKRVVSTLAHFMNVDLSAFYFDIRKDALYCEAKSSLLRRSALTVIHEIFETITIALAPILSFTAEEAWLLHKGEGGSVHLEGFKNTPIAWHNEALALKWDKVREVRKAITGALEVERAAKTIGSSLEAAPVVMIGDASLFEAVKDLDMAEIAITSSITISQGGATPVDVTFKRAEGIKCARSWKYFDASTADSDYPEITPRDAKAMRELFAV